MKPAEILASVAAIFGIGWLVYGRKPGAEKGQDETFEAPGPVTLSPEKKARLSGHLSAMRPGLVLVLGREPAPFELVYMTAVAGLETGWGQGWKCQKDSPPECAASVQAAKSSNNWGAIQANSTWKGATFDWFDRYPDGRLYTQKFRAYPTPAEGAADVARFIARLPKTMEALSEGRSVYRASLAMRREKYYGSFCPKAVAKYGAGIARASVSNPDRDEGTLACEKEAVGLHANRAYGIARDLFAALEVPAVPLGTFEDAFAWYKKAGSQA